MARRDRPQRVPGADAQAHARADRARRRARVAARRPADLAEIADRRAEFAELTAAIAELPIRQREAIALRDFLGLSYEEVASTLSVSVPVVESLLFRARRTASRHRPHRAALRGRASSPCRSRCAPRSRATSRTSTPVRPGAGSSAARRRARRRAGEARLAAVRGEGGGRDRRGRRRGHGRRAAARRRAGAGSATAAAARHGRACVGRGRLAARPGSCPGWQRHGRGRSSPRRPAEATARRRRPSGATGDVDAPPRSDGAGRALPPSPTDPAPRVDPRIDRAATDPAATARSAPACDGAALDAGACRAAEPCDTSDGGGAGSRGPPPADASPSRRPRTPVAGRSRRGPAARAPRRGGDADDGTGRDDGSPGRRRSGRRVDGRTPPGRLRPGCRPTRARRRAMPELPEIEALRRSLDEPVAPRRSSRPARLTSPR